MEPDLPADRQVDLESFKALLSSDDFRAFALFFDPAHAQAYSAQNDPLLGYRFVWTQDEALVGYVAGLNGGVLPAGIRAITFCVSSNGIAGMTKFDPMTPAGRWQMTVILSKAVLC